MQDPATVATEAAPLQCKFLINTQQQPKKVGVLQQGMAHLDGLLAW